MKIQEIKTRLISIFGSRFVSYIQAVRFVYLLKSNRNLEPEIGIIQHLLKRGDVAIDVGANGADWTYRLHRCVGDHGVIYAFEADPYYAMATDAAIKLLHLRGVVVFPFGLSDKDQEVVLRVFDDRNVRLAGRGYVDKNASRGDSGTEVIQLRRLDSLVQEYPQIAQASLIKCDVEGFELFVFRGASAVLAKSRPVVILEVGNYHQHGYSAQDVYDFFAAIDYLPFAMIGKDKISPTNLMLEHPQALSVNRILIPREKVDSISAAEHLGLLAEKP